jgi:hypothetical protein
MTALFRLYEPEELGRDGYPPEWHARIKHEVRAEAGHRCVRCGHPYQGGAEWSPCDEQCRHGGPIRARPLQGRWIVYEDDDAGPLLAMGSVEKQARWRILTVHHLDGVKANCRWWNLVALCQRCHLQIQGKVQMARVWPWEHSGWFRPYVAGYYAFAYLGEDLDRAAAEERMDELLALERVA